MNMRMTAGYMVSFFNNRLLLMYAIAGQKYIPSRTNRVSCPLNVGDDGTGRGDDGIPQCLTESQSNRTFANSQQGSAGSGGLMNDNWLLVNSFYVQFLFTPKLWASISFEIQNFFAFSIDEETLSNDGLPEAGQRDWTYGDINVSFMPVDHFVLGMGIQSYQPALTADNSSIRFPFYDFVSPSNNYTRWYLTATAVF